MFIHLASSAQSKPITSMHLKATSWDASTSHLKDQLNVSWLFPQFQNEHAWIINALWVGHSLACKALERDRHLMSPFPFPKASRNQLEDKWVWWRQQLARSQSLLHYHPFFFLWLQRYPKKLQKERESGCSRDGMEHSTYQKIFSLALAEQGLFWDLFT